MGSLFDETSPGGEYPLGSLHQNSMCVNREKIRAEENLFGSRLLAGKIELGGAGHADFAGTTLASPGQSNNALVSSRAGPDRAVEKLPGASGRAAEYERGISPETNSRVGEPA